MMRCGLFSVFPKVSPKNLNRYVAEFTGRHNVREYDARDQMAELVIAMEGKRLRHDQLIADNGLSARAQCLIDKGNVMDVMWKRLK